MKVIQCIFVLLLCSFVVKCYKRNEADEGLMEFFQMMLNDPEFLELKDSQQLAILNAMYTILSNHIDDSRKSAQQKRASILQKGFKLF